jgi:hypothetical protein
MAVLANRDHANSVASRSCRERKTTGIPKGKKLTIRSRSSNCKGISTADVTQKAHGFGGCPCAA